MNGRSRSILCACSIIALIWVIAVRLTGPSDFYEKNQPNTISYTTDIILHGRWILPTEVGGRSATKPPLYNWLAVPFVSVLGTTSEAAHRVPSILAFAGCWLLLILIGRRMNAPAVGYIAATAFVLNPAMFKLGLLARPDPPLTFFLILGWMLATVLIVNVRERPAQAKTFAFALAFWLCVALAALSKGPPALVLVIYAAVAPRILVGSWRDAAVFGWLWGLPLAVAPFAAWILASYSIDPEHVVDQLWGQEVAGRITGLGEEGSRLGPIGFLYGLGHMPFYYISRFLPWSIISVLALIELRQDRTRDQKFADGMARLWLIASTTFLVIIIVFFTLSTGKRAAYIAAAYGPGAILAAWWIVWFFTVRPARANAFASAPEDPPASSAGARRLPWIVAAVASILLGLLTVYDRMDARAPTPRFGDHVMAFILQAAEMIERETAAATQDGIMMWEFDHLLTRAMLGLRPMDAEEARHLLEAGRDVWVFALKNTDAARSVTGLLAAIDASVELDSVPLLTSADLPEEGDWPGRVTLWRLSPLAD